MGHWGKDDKERNYLHHHYFIRFENIFYLYNFVKVRVELNSLKIRKSCLQSQILSHSQNLCMLFYRIFSSSTLSFILINAVLEAAIIVIWYNSSLASLKVEYLYIYIYSIYSPTIISLQVPSTHNYWTQRRSTAKIRPLTERTERERGGRTYRGKSARGRAGSAIVLAEPRAVRRPDRLGKLPLSPLLPLQDRTGHDGLALTLYYDWMAQIFLHIHQNNLFAPPLSRFKKFPKF